MASLSQRCRAATEPTAPDPIRRIFAGPDRMMSNLGTREGVGGP